MNGKKGISPLIATVLIVGFTIVLAVLVITWISGTVQDTTTKSDCQTDAGNICLANIGNVKAAFATNDVVVNNEGSVVLGVRVLFLSNTGATLLVSPDATSNPTSISAFGSQTFDGDTVPTAASARVIVTATSTVGDGCTIECGNPIEITK